MWRLVGRRQVLPPSSPPVNYATQRAAAISGAAANMAVTTGAEPRRLPEEILSAADVPVCGRDLWAALPRYLLWLPVLHFPPSPPPPPYPQ